MKKQRCKEARIREVRNKKAKRTRNSFFFASCFLSLCLFCGGCSSRSAQQQDQVCFKDQCVNVEVVQKEEELHRGLQFRKSLNPDSGMLFIFKKSWPYAFWMKDTLIPLDMVWMDYGRRVVHIEHNVPPCAADPCPSYAPEQEALYVLEINAGYAEKFKLELGDTAEFKLKEAEKQEVKK